MSDYFTGTEDDNCGFLKMSKIFWNDPKYADLGIEECVVYSFLCEQVVLSRKNNWIDEDGKIFVIRKIESIRSILRGCSEDKARAVLKNLVKFGLIEKKRRGQGKPDLIYVKAVQSNNQKNTDLEPNDIRRDSSLPEPENNGFLTTDISDSRTMYFQTQEPEKTMPNNNNHINNNYKEQVPTTRSVCDYTGITQAPVFITDDDAEKEIHRKICRLEAVFFNADFGKKDIRALLKAAGGDDDAVIQAYDFLLQQSGHISNPIGWMIAAIKEGYYEPKEIKPKNNFMNFDQRTYDFEALEKEVPTWKPIKRPRPSPLTVG